MNRLNALLRSTGVRMTRLPVAFVLVAALMAAATAHAQQASGASGPQASTPQPAGTLASIEPPPGYVIGSEDVLNVVFWREKDLSTEVTVRPDGKISLPLINDIQTAGLTPEQLRVRITEAAGKFVQDPTVSVVVKTINSRRVYIVGQVAKPGPYALSAPITVMQLIAMAGGLHEFADREKIVILRQGDDGKQTALDFNYKDVLNRKLLTQNIELKAGDTVVVP